MEYSQEEAEMYQGAELHDLSCGFVVLLVVVLKGQSELNYS